MLLRKDCRRYQKSNLLAILYRLKCRPDRNFCLAISYITTYQSVHNTVTFHICLGSFDCKQLILRLFKRKHFFKFLLPDCIMSKGKSLFLLPECIQFHKILCHFIDCTFHPGLGFSPFLCSKFIQLRTFGSISRGIFLNDIQSRCQNIEITAIPVFYFDIILYNLIDLYLFNSFIYTQSMILMHNIITDFQV